MLVDRCPSCSKPVEEKDDVCPFCGKDFASLPKRRPFSPDAGPGTGARPPQAPPPEAARAPVRVEDIPPAALPRNASPLAPRALLYAAAALLIGGGLWLLRRPARDADIPVLAARPAAPPHEPPRDASPAAAPAVETPPAAPRPALLRPRAQEPRPTEAARRASAVHEDVPVVMISRGTRPRELRVQGTVFDLVTLAPVPDVEIVFVDPATGHRAATGTDAAGRYRARLPASEAGFDMTASHPDYEPKYVLDGTPPFRTLARKDRLQAALDEGRTLQHKELLPSSEEDVRRDLALIPLQLPAE